MTSSWAPVPVKVMVWIPEVSLPLITQVVKAGPARVGEKRTVSASCACAGITVPSDREVRALKPLAVGGLDLVIVSGVPPWLPTVKLTIPLWPIATVPTPSWRELIVIWGSGAADPSSGTVVSPALVLITRWSSKVWTKSPEVPGGVKTTGTLSVP